MSLKSAEYLRTKYGYFFDFLDRDNDGFVTKEDFFENLEDLKRSGQFSAEKIQGIIRDYWEWWSMYEMKADKNGKVSREALIDSFYDFHLTTDVTGPIKNHYATLFDSIDKDHDGEITFEELRLYYKAHNWCDEDHIREVFQRMDLNHDGGVTRDELVEAGRKFWVCEDPASGSEFMYCPKH